MFKVYQTVYTFINEYEVHGYSKTCRYGYFIACCSYQLFKLLYSHHSMTAVKLKLGKL